MPSPPPSEFPPELEYLGSGSLNHIFGHDDWVLKIRRWTPLGVASRALISPRWIGRAGRTLGGCVLPSARIHRITFRAARPDAERPKTEAKIYHASTALVLPRIAECDFLNQQLSRADALNAIRLMGEMLDVLERTSARGFHLLDFITSNFATYEGALVIADPDLLVPRHFLRWSPTCIVTARQFRVHLATEFDRLLAEKQERATPKEVPVVANFRAALPDRLRSLTSPPLRQKLAPPQSAPLPDPIFRSATRILTSPIPHR